MDADVIRIEADTLAHILDATQAVKLKQFALGPIPGTSPTQYALFYKASGGGFTRFPTMVELTTLGSATFGAALVGAKGITGVTPTGGAINDDGTVQALLEGLKTYMDAAVAAGSVGIIQDVDFGLASTFVIDPTTSVLRNIGTAASDITLTWPAADTYLGGVLTIVAGNMAGFNVIADPTGASNYINGSGVATVINPAIAGAYPYLQAQPIEGSGFGWTMTGMGFPVRSTVTNTLTVLQSEISGAINSTDPEAELSMLQTSPSPLNPMGATIYIPANTFTKVGQFIRFRGRFDNDTGDGIQFRTRLNGTLVHGGALGTADFLSPFAGGTLWIESEVTLRDVGAGTFATVQRLVGSDGQVVGTSLDGYEETGIDLASVITFDFNVNLSVPAATTENYKVIHAITESNIQGLMP